MYLRFLILLIPLYKCAFRDCCAPSGNPEEQRPLLPRPVPITIDGNGASNAAPGAGDATIDIGPASSAAASAAAATSSSPRRAP